MSINLLGASSNCRYYTGGSTPQPAAVLYLRSGAGIFAHREAFASQQRL